MEKDNEMPILIFDDSSKDKVLETLGFSQEDSHLIDEEGLIQTNQQFEEISEENFGGILQGSKIFIKKDPSEIVKYFASKED